MRDSGASGIVPNKVLGGFDGFADMNPFTMKTLDAYVFFSFSLLNRGLAFFLSYRMHLWGKMAAQQQLHQQQNQTLQNQNQQRLGSGMASNLPALHFVPSPKANVLPTSSSGYGNTLSAILSGKHNVSPSTSAYPTPPASPLLLPKAGASLPLPILHSLHPSSHPTTSASASTSTSTTKEQQAMLAAMASQTVP